MTLDTLELKLHYFQKILPRRDRRRGLINLGGSVLQTLFGVATNSYIHLLHDTLNELQSSTSAIVHFLFSQVQVTYIKKLDVATKINSDAVANLSTIVKDIVIRSYDRYQESKRDMDWLNPKLFDQSAIRQLEFALFLTIQQINELLGTIQSAMQSKLPLNFINPATLQNILRNVSLHLPEGYELIAGTRMDNIHLYYELITVTMVGNVHVLNLIMTIPLKTANQHFALYKIIVLLSCTFGNNFARFEFPYFGIDDSQRDYILFTETRRSRCTINSITLCPADVPIYSQQVVTCESSLFFQASTSNQLC